MSEDEEIQRISLNEAIAEYLTDEKWYDDFPIVIWANQIKNDVEVMTPSQKRSHFFYKMVWENGKGDYLYVFEHFFRPMVFLQGTVVLEQEYLAKNVKQRPQQMKNDFNSVTLRRNYFKKESLHREALHTCTGDYREDVYNYFQDYMFYNALGEEDADLTKFARDVKHNLCEELIKTLLISPESLKMICYQKLLTVDVNRTIVDFDSCLRLALVIKHSIMGVKLI